jgi:hypothetical protein
MAEFPLIAFVRECVIGACLARQDRVEHHVGQTGQAKPA